jgi:RNA polymerase sigma-70 factor, ECF subfamily
MVQAFRKQSTAGGAMRDAYPRPGSEAELQPSSATSPSLLERVKADDAAAWDRLVTLYAPLVFHWCRRWDLQDEDAADVFQEVFQAVATHIADFRRARKEDTFRGWLRTITRNKVHDHFRRLGRQPRGVGGTDAQIRLVQLPAPEPPEDDPAAEEKAERGLFYRALDLIRGEFEERTWQAFWRTAVDGAAPKDVAAELSMRPGAVRVAKSRVLRRLREELGDLLD